MGKWYVMRTVPGKEAKAAELIERTVEHRLWVKWRILKKQKLFRVKGHLVLNVEDLFPGYIFVKTEHPQELSEALERSREYPRMIGNVKAEIIPVEEKDLEFLKNVCGYDLQNPMELSEVEADEEGNLIHIDGILKNYENRIVRKRLRKRYVLAEIDLFSRKENILFGIRMPGDEILEENGYSRKTRAATRLSATVETAGEDIAVT